MSSSAPPATGKRRRVRRGRYAALALGAGVAVTLVFALVFSVAFGSKGVSQHAQALHDADEALRAATVARAQAGFATHLSLLQREFDFDSQGSIERSIAETRLALEDLRAALADLEADAGIDATVQSSANRFTSTVEEILSLLETDRSEEAEALSAAELDRDFRVFTGAIVIVRDFQAAEVANSNALMGRIGDVARFLVAFLVPTAAIFVYRELTRRQARQKELEVRLETEQEIGKARDEFVANASHELRTPLTSIFGLAHLLEEDPSIHGNPAASEMVGMIISETHDLSRMVDDLLTTARLDAGALHYQFEDLSVLEEIPEVVGPIERSGQAIGVHAQPAMVRSDRLRIRQVVRNLLSNAVKYGGDQIRLIGRVTNGWYEMRVEDDGPGIPAELEQRLFQRYLHKGDAPLTLGSVGLGLSIVRALAEGMGGAVWYERREGWTSFVVRVPLAAHQPSDLAARDGNGARRPVPGRQAPPPLVGTGSGRPAPPPRDRLPQPPPPDRLPSAR